MSRSKSPPVVNSFSRASKKEGKNDQLLRYQLIGQRDDLLSKFQNIHEILNSGSKPESMKLKEIVEISASAQKLKKIIDKFDDTEAVVRNSPNRFLHAQSIKEEESPPKSKSSISSIHNILGEPLGNPANNSVPTGNGKKPQKIIEP